ncbi:MAG: undecaprenyl/decaprenyl-phosphate alpha-N-acetylglucosaminyl 1-phosphate transferase, partial [Actinobacteria bacterium]
MASYYTHIALFVFSALIALAITPLVEKIAVKLGAVDIPDERKVHGKPVPRLGGLTIFLTIFLGIIAYLVWQLTHQSFNFRLLLNANYDLLGIFIGSSMMFVFGCLDDIFDVSPGFKFLGQLLSASVVVIFGTTIDFIGSPGGGLINIPSWLGIFITIFWIVGLTNTVNFIDGLDGLAAGVVSIAGVALYVSAIQTGKVNMAVIMVVLCGALLGFLRYNFNPAKIFMGDSGSMFLGFLIGSLTVQAATKSAATIALLVPIVIMGVPIFDAGWAIWRRFINKKPLTKADKEHIHHRLMRQGFSQRRTVLVIYAWSA